MHRNRIHTAHRKVFITSRPTKMTVMINSKKITDKGIVKSKEQFNVMAR